MASMFEWDVKNQEHLREHGFTQQDAEEAWLDSNNLPVDATWVEGEWRDAIIGMTRDARLVHVVWTEHGNLVRLFEARKPTRREARLYLDQ
jgi:uncharacterized DUF497 family protein